MRYLAEVSFITANGKPFTMTSVKGTERSTEEATISEVLHWLLINYHPQVFQNAGHPILNNADLRCLNRAIDILEDEPQEDHYYRLEDQDFAVIKKVVLVMAPVLTPRNSPILEDVLEAAPKSLLKVVGVGGEAD